VSVLDGLSAAEKIVWLFERKVTEAHRATIELTLHLSEMQFDQAVARARDLGAEQGLYLTPVYEREGWWTCEPTRRIAAIALRESVRRNYGEAERNHRVLGDDFGKRITHAAGVVESGLAGSLAIIRELPEIRISSGADYVLDRIDAAWPPRLFVSRNGVAA